MTYDEIIEALNSGLIVHWSNSGYIVKWDKANLGLFTLFTRNQSYCKLQPTEYEDCFITKVGY